MTASDLADHLRSVLAANRYEAQYVGGDERLADELVIRRVGRK